MLAFRDDINASEFHVVVDEAGFSMPDDFPTDSDFPLNSPDAQDENAAEFSEQGTEVQLPQKVGPWHIVRKLGAGGMGTVYLGRHEETDQTAAVKVLSAALAREEGTVDRFMREIETVSRLRSRNIVSFYGSGRDEKMEQFYFAMEYVSGETLADWIRREGRLSWDQVVDISLQICAALKAAHAAGVIHRDLKPSNLLIGTDGHVKLTDFGVAQVFAAQRLTITGGVIGTAEYMSPEQTEGRRANRNSDLYALGAVMYVMLTGRPPFTGKTAFDIIRKHQTARFDRPGLYAPEIPRPLDEVVCTLLNKEPDDRYGDAHIVALRLTEVIRRVELAEKEELNQAFTPERQEAPTVTSTYVRKSESVEPRGPGPATMVRNVFREEIARQGKKTALGSLFDNTWVLTGTLIFILAGMVVWFRNVDTADQNFSSAESDSAQNSEVERFWFLARVHRRERNPAEEQRVLIALRDVLSGSSEFETRLDQIEQRLAELRQERSEQAADYELAHVALQRAELLISRKEWDTADRIVRGVLVLYGTEHGAQTLTENASRLRAQIEAERAD
ncbi:MAG: protein kinase [Planctomycetaceae bacterium]